jgi:hypothetical protein
MISASAHNARENARATDGTFGCQARSEPEVAIPAPAAESGEVGVLTGRRADAAAVFLAAKHTYMLANRDLAAARLRAEFPWATLAVFTRSWDDLEDRIVLSELIGPDDTFDLEDDQARAAALSPEQVSALAEARTLIQDMGGDVSSYLDLPDQDHDGWHEYDLDLAAAPAPEDAYQQVTGALDLAGRDRLYNTLSETDGRMASMVDTTEIAYQITDGHLQDTDPDLADALIAKHGSAQAAAEAIADSDGWFAFREEVADDLHERVKDAIAESATALLKGDA